MFPSDSSEEIPRHDKQFKHLTLDRSHLVVTQPLAYSWLNRTVRFEVGDSLCVRASPSSKCPPQRQDLQFSSAAVAFLLPIILLQWSSGNFHLYYCSYTIQRPSNAPAEYVTGALDPCPRSSGKRVASYHRRATQDSVTEA